VFCGINVAAAALRAVWALLAYRPAKLKFGIEKNRILWEAVMKSYANGCLFKVREAELDSKTQR